jgi:hypothetical protein
MNRILPILFFLFFFPRLDSQETKKFKVSKIVADKINSTFKGISIQSLSEIREMDQYLIDGKISIFEGKSLEIHVSITGENGVIVSATVRPVGFKNITEKEALELESVNPDIPWKKIISRLDRKDRQAGISFLNISESSGEREYQMSINHFRDSKSSVYHFDEFGNFIRKEKLRY